MKIFCSSEKFCSFGLKSVTFSQLAVAQWQLPLRRISEWITKERQEQEKGQLNIEWRAITTCLTEDVHQRFNENHIINQKQYFRCCVKCVAPPPPTTDRHLKFICPNVSFELCIVYTPLAVVSRARKTLRVSTTSTLGHDALLWKSAQEHYKVLYWISIMEHSLRL
jgi:hypothetical protein